CSIEPRSVGPPLAQEAQRVNLAWLENYLRHPIAIRPFGYHPGEGSRMPDFRLSGEEASLASAFITSNAPLPNPLLKGERQKKFEPRALSRFAQRKAETLLATKLSCLGC